MSTDANKKKKPARRKLKITVIARNMAGGAILSFDNHKDIVVKTQKYRVGDAYRIPIKKKRVKKK